MPITQETHLLSVATHLPKDVLLLTSLAGKEELSRLFRYELTMLSSNDNLAGKDMVGKPIAFQVTEQTGAPRFFHGMISRWAAGGLNLRDLREYKAEVVPWLWFLTRTADCRLFQNKSAKDIIEQVFKDLGFTDFKFDLQENHPKREYCVQYRQSDFDFVSWLMEEEGIYYYFLHEEKKHTLVISDHKGAYKDCVEKEVEFASGTRTPNTISSWEHQYEFRPGKWAQTDYNFETPSTNLMTTADTLFAHGTNSKFEVYDYPGEYRITADGKALTKFRMGEDEAPHDVVLGASTCKTFTTGHKFKLKKHGCASEQGKGFVITAIQHSASDTSHLVGGGSQVYGNTFTCIPDAVVFRPERRTPRPLVRGPQPAVVVGPKGEEIYTDKYGRVKMQFFWDREGKKDENSTCWVRVATVWAGKRWGVTHTPRIGQEVIVDFYEGDPDQPIIIGSVYNAEQMPAYLGDGPDSKHKNDNKLTGIKTNTTKGGAGFNEIRFDDTKDAQQIFMHGEKDLDVRIKNDRREWIGHDRHLMVINDKFEDVNRDTHIHIKRDQLEHIERNHEWLVTGMQDIIIKKDKKELLEENNHFHVKKDRTALIDGNQMITVKKDQKELVEGADHLHVKKDQATKVDGAVGLEVGKDQMTKIAGACNLDVGKDHLTKVGKNLGLDIGGDLAEKIGKGYSCDAGADVYIKAGKTLILEAGMQISLKVGGCFVDISAAGGVAINGLPSVLINSGGAGGTGVALRPLPPPPPAAPADATAPTDAKEAKPVQPKEADNAVTGQKSAP